MKKYLLAVSLFLTLTQVALAGDFYYYIHNTTGKMMSLYNINEADQTAVYYDHDYKKQKINLSQVSRETYEPINNIQQGKYALYQAADGSRVCQVYHVFLNGQTLSGCQTGKPAKIIGVQRPQVGHYKIGVKILIGEVPSKDGFNKKDKVRLNANIGDLQYGSKVRIEAIFPTGEALIQKAGLNLLDTSDPLMKYGTEKVNLSDLAK